MYKKVVLDNGVRLVYEKIPHVRSISIGIWVGTGSRYENETNNGVSHFIEHMVFKGTEKRSAKEIAECIDNIGGQINAFTGKECTCYYTKTLDTHYEIAIDVLADMFFNSKLTKTDIDIERKVILEEIGMYEDSPEELVHDLFSETVWDGNSLGFPILGTEASLEGINRDVIVQYMKQNYTPENTVISVAGNFDDEKLIKTVSKYFNNRKFETNRPLRTENAEFKKNTRVKEKDTEQTHICIGFSGLEHGDDNLYSLLAVNNILGGGMSSRLFQKIREERGLVYSIYSFLSSYKDSGLYVIYAGMNPEQLDIVVDLIKAELNTLISSGISEDELEKSKEQLKGNYILGLESTSSIMNSIGKSELLLNDILTPEEILAKIDNINMESINKVIKSIFDINNASFCVVGNIKKDIDVENLF
jgi:predicted Zn-dependent peptidase